MKFKHNLKYFSSNYPDKNVMNGWTDGWTDGLKEGQNDYNVCSPMGWCLKLWLVLEKFKNTCINILQLKQHNCNVM